MKKIYLLIGVGIVLLSIAIAVKKYSGNDGITVTTENVENRTIVETVSANGKIQPEVEVKMSSDVSGEIVELHVKEGGLVQKGDLLLKIKPDIYLSNLERMEAALNSSKANALNVKARLLQVKAQFTNAEASFNRNKKLFDQGAISQSDFDIAKAAYEGAKADAQGAEENVKAAEFGITSSQASLKEANENLAKTNVYAPTTGTISKLNVELGERVVGTSQMTGTEILRIANLNEMEVNVEVNENDIVRVSLSDTSLIEVDAYLGRKFKGIVTEIANSANTTGTTADQVTNFTVKIRILRESYSDLMDEKQPNVSPFRPGMSATVDIQTNSVSNVITVPIQAVTTRIDSMKNVKKGKEKQEEDEFVVKDTREKNDKAKKEIYDKPQECIFIYKEGKAIKTIVKTGIQDNNYIQILEGIEEGTEVITGPYGAVSRLLKDGSEVVKVDKEVLFEKGKKK